MKIFRYLAISALLTLLTVGAYAQSTMTDSQVANYVVKEKMQGSTDQDIARRLIQRGVPIEQLRRVKTQLEKQQGTSSSGSKSTTGTTTQDRLRKNNSNARKETTEQQTNTVNLRKTQTQPNRAFMTDEQRKQYDALNEEEYANELGTLYADTATLYENLLKTVENNRRKVFGRDIFNNKELTFEPNMNIATPSDYRLGPGDAVFVDVYGASQKTFESTVSPEGVINIEGYGPVQVSGMTVAQANKHLQTTLGQRYSSSKIRLSVGQTKTITVNISGEVNMPGTYTLSAFATVFNALYMAGGINDIGTLRNIKVYRNGKHISTVDIYEYIMNGKLSGNIRLAPNDMIIVGAYDCLVNITGKVKRPMFYEMRHDESVATLLKYAGGFTGDAYEKSIRLIRKSGGEYSVFSLEEFERGTFKVMDGDSVSIDSALNRFSNMVEIKGAVFRPGMYNVGRELATVRDLIRHADGVKEDAILERGVLHRRKADRTLEVVPVNIRGILDHSVADITLRNEDVLFIQSTTDLQEARTLSIFGEIMVPGVFPYADNTTIEDLILQAGGLTDAASLVKVDISRRIRDRSSVKSGKEVAHTFSLKLKDNFVIEGEPGFVLEPYDEVYVRKSPGYSELQHVMVEGEVTFSGVYTIDKKGLRLSDLIKTAGGLTPEAYAKGARLERRLTEAEKIKQTSLLKLVNSSDSLDTKKLELGDTRNVGINLDRALANPGSHWDMVLQEGDKLIVPQYSNTVSINGEVMYPSSVVYREGANLDHYINAAGGFSTQAKKGRVFVINMNGTVSRVRSAKDIQPGGEIVVPAKPSRKTISFAEILGLGSTVASLGAVVAALLK